MKRIALLLAFVLVAAACGDDDAGGPTTTTAATATSQAPAETTTTAAAETTTTTAAETTTTAAPTTTAAEAHEVGLAITSLGFESDMVVITNFGSETIDLSGYWLCQRPSYAAIPSVELAPGEFLSINLGSDVFLPIPGSKTIEGSLNVGGLNPTSGELALYSSNSFGSAEAIVSYVEWGTAGHGRSSFAVQAGIWPEGGFVPTEADTVSIFATEQPPLGPDDYDAL